MPLQAGALEKSPRSSQESTRLLPFHFELLHRACQTEEYYLVRYQQPEWSPVAAFASSAAIAAKELALSQLSAVADAKAGGRDPLR